jgi:PAS domain S-box-containing protein
MTPRKKSGQSVPRRKPVPKRALDSLGASEALQAVFEKSPDIVMIVDRERRISYVNRLFPQLTSSQVYGADLCTFVPPEYRAAMAACYARVFRDGVSERYEVTGPGPDGSMATYDSRVVPIVHDGRVTEALVTAADITERRRAEQTQLATYRISASAHTATSLQSLFAAIHGIVGGLMPARNFYIALHDPATDTISFPYFVDEYDPRPAPKRPGKGLTEYVLRTGQPLLATPEVAKDLERRGEVEVIGAPSIDWLGVPLKTRTSTIGALVVQTYGEDVRYGEPERSILEFVSTQVAMAIEHKRAEEALRQSEETLKTFLDAIPETALLINLDGTIAAANRGLLEGVGLDSGDLVGHNAFDYSTPDLVESRKAKIDEVVRTGEPVVFEDTSVASGRTHINYVHPVRDEAGRVSRVAVVGLDITERKRAEEALRRSEEQSRTLVDSARDVIFALSPDGLFVALNPAFEKLTGWPREEWMGKPFTEVLHADDVPAARELFAKILRSEPPPNVQFRFRSREGGYLVGEITANIPRQDGRLLGIVRDVTDRVRLEDQLRQAQKMEAVGRLAGGVAHDFNNLLTAISGYSELLLSDLAPGDPRRADVEEIKKATERAASLTRQLLAFSRRQVLQPRVLDLNVVVAGAEKLLRRLIGEDIRLVTRFEPALGAVRADAGQIEQVVMNLAVNARDAMPGGGTLTVETRNADITVARRTEEQAPMPPGRYVELRVSDTGVGIGAEVKRHIFEPFFTTREKGTGTGLGLATVYGIVKQSGGFIWVDSEPGRGATFTIHLPQVAQGVETAEPGRPVRTSIAGTETVLLVEDEAAVRTVARESLRIYGYRVLEAPDGEVALRVAADAGAGIDLLLTDVIMPGLSGPALADRLRAERPGIRVLYMSGYTDDALGPHGVLEPGLNYLQKPFTPDVLAQKVRQVLDLPS